jgi:hypothetical protein
VNCLLVEIGKKIDTEIGSAEHLKYFNFGKVRIN